MPEPRPDHIQEECHDQDRRDKLHYAQPFLWVSARPCAPKRFFTRRNGGRHPPQSIMPNWLSAIILAPDTSSLGEPTLAMSSPCRRYDSPALSARRAPLRFQVLLEWPAPRLRLEQRRGRIKLRHGENVFTIAIKPAAHVNSGSFLCLRRAMRSILTRPSIRRRRMWRPSTSTSSIR